MGQRADLQTCVQSIRERVSSNDSYYGVLSVLICLLPNTQMSL